MIVSFKEDIHKAITIRIMMPLSKDDQEYFWNFLQSLKHFLLNNLKGDKSLGKLFHIFSLSFLTVKWFNSFYLTELLWGLSEKTYR